jgi:hypothetical protein
MYIHHVYIDNTYAYMYIHTYMQGSGRKKGSRGGEDSIAEGYYIYIYVYMNTCIYMHMYL